MFRIEKRFTVPIGHRLSKHKGRCFSIHGHNFTVLVGLMANNLNVNDMIIDFSDLKSIVNEILDSYDHTLLVNKRDADWVIPLAQQLGTRAQIFHEEEYDPTAERLAEKLFKDLYKVFINREANFEVEYVTVYENENSKATYSFE
jgi:6-pyruvoyltetrahydropterin/6-carboxytetrahydropterin synthase